eukprot:TRINITY_DN46553_c0_g1_i2.p1 TRINITY_DN46553_c0_g1~~TRINITY_DN46553_c0_g1_i2.p1  ORF type:complete len:537 (-),score=77.85 TRINITY_DN46553_c0_g1_i2:284-1894(-)
MEGFMKAGCAGVDIPANVRIENPRLGLLLRVLQVASVVFVLYNLISSNGYAWSVEVKPTGQSISLWRELPNASVSADMPSWCSPEGLDALAMTDGVYDYRPTECKLLPESESLIKDGSHLYFPTYIWDTYVSERQAGNCGSCNHPGEVVETDGSHCHCKRKKQYLVSDVDKQILNFNHGYKVKYGLKPGASTFLGYETGSSREAHVLTVFKPSNRAIENNMDCLIGGKSKHGKSPNGIRGTLEEFLKCAGIKLNDISTSPGVHSEQDTPHHPELRLCGVALKITLNFLEHHSHDFDGVTCEVTIDADEVWNSRSQVHYTQVPDVDTGIGSYRYRYMFGVSVDEVVMGTFQEFNYDQLIKFLAAQLVMLSLPTKVVTFVVLYCVGVLSTVYERAVNRRLQMRNRLAGFCTRLMGYTETFKTVTSITGSNELSAAEFADSLKVSFSKNFETGQLNEQAVVTLATAVLDHLAEGGKGAVTAGEFLQACTGNEDLSIPVVAKLLDPERRPPVGEMVFSNLLMLRRRPTGDSAKVHPDDEA